MFFNEHTQVGLVRYLQQPSLFVISPLCGESIAINAFVLIGKRVRVNSDMGIFINIDKCFYYDSDARSLRLLC